MHLKIAEEETTADQISAIASQVKSQRGEDHLLSEHWQTYNYKVLLPDFKFSSITCWFFLDQTLYIMSYVCFGASLVAQMVKNPPAMQESWVWSLVGKISWRRECLPIPILLPGEFQGQRSLVAYSPWGCKELDMTEWLTHTCFAVLKKLSV